MPKTKTDALKDAPRYFRAAVARGLAAGDGGPKIDRTGGMFGAGLISGFAVITRGEALGHGVWIDDEFLRQTSTALAGSDGVRVRFTHPGMSSDGLGRKLGRAVFAGRDGDVVRADLHFTKTSHSTPEGDLAEYVMSLAEEDPEQFGASIVYEYDYHAEEAHYHEHVSKETGDFESPDPLNKKNLPHARLAELRAVDIVDEPAANPGGMFHASEIPAEADALVAYALGLSDDKPGTLLGVDPDRLRGFASRFMSYRGLSVVGGSEMPKGKTSLSETPTAEPTTEAVTSDTPDAGEGTPETSSESSDETQGDETDTKGTDASDGEDASLSKAKKFRESFGAEDGFAYFTEGLTFEQALEKSHTKLKAENEQLREQKAAALAAAGGEPVEGGHDGGAATPAKQSVLTDGQERFAAGIKLPGQK